MVKDSKTVKKIGIGSYPTGIELLRGETTKIFLSLVEHTPLQVGYLFGLDRFYSTDASIRSAVYKVYQWVLEDPEKYDIPQETAGKVQQMTKDRTIKATKVKALKNRESQEMALAGTTELITKGVDRSLGLLHKKFDELERPGGLKNVKLTDLVKAVTAMFDKGQIARGEATQNIAILSKNITSDMDASSALEAVIAGREAVAVQKEKLKNDKG